MARSGGEGDPRSRFAIRLPLQTIANLELYVHVLIVGSGVRGLRDCSMMWYLELSLPLNSRVKLLFNGMFVNLAGCQLILRSALSFAFRPSPLVPFPTPQPFSPM